MLLRLNFGQKEESKDLQWWSGMTSFPILVLYKTIKWEFVAYLPDDTKKYDYICHFSEIPPYSHYWSATNFEEIDSWINGDTLKCVCGAKHTSFPNHHMLMCPKWEKW